MLEDLNKQKETTEI